MESIMNWGIAVILWLQQFSPTLNLPFRALTFVGDEEFFLLFLPFLYWCLDRRSGARLTLLFLLSAYTNALAKVLVDQPRPFEVDPRVQQLSAATGGGLPSGHTQNTTAVWGYLAFQHRRRWLWIAAGLLILLVPLSRLYLGVHFPHDLLGGYVLGALLLLGYLWLEPSLERWLAQQGLARQLALALIAPLLLMLIFLTEDGVTTGATLLGMGVGFVLERHQVGFDAGGAWWRRGLRFLLGLIVLIGLWGGLRAAFSGLEPALLFRFLRYGLVGLWSAFGAPWVFVKLRLAQAR